MQSWNLVEIETPGGSRSPVVLRSDANARAVLITLDAGQSLGDHQVKEGVLITVVDGAVRMEAGGETVDAGVGCLFSFDPNERHSVSSERGARLLLVFSPWPGDGHYRGEERSR